MTAAALAVGQAGWKNPLLIYGLFGAAAVFFLASLFWGSLSKRIGPLKRVTSYIRNSFRARFAVQVLIACSALFVIYTAVQAEVRDKGENGRSANTLVLHTDTPVREAYNQDFKNYLRLFTSVNFHETAGDRYADGNQQIVISFETNTEFMAFYIPDTDLVYGICFSIAEHYKEMLSHMRRLVIKRQDEGDFNKFDSSNLRFSGMIYIYTENGLEQRGIEDLQVAFKKHGASIQFRTPANIKPSQQLGR